MIFRPYPDIEKSVLCLSEHDLHFYGRLNSSLLVQSILGGLSITEHSALLLKSDTGKFYWNNGKPYLNDLMYYYNVAEEAWLNVGGAGYPYLKDCEEAISECEFIENEYEWSEEEAIVHKLVLLKRDREWYKRKFIDLKRFHIIDDYLYEKDGTPRRIKPEQLIEKCIII